MKVLVLCEYPPLPAGLSTQAELLVRGLSETGVDVRAVGWESTQEKEWYYRWYKPDIAIGVGFWGYTPQIIFHPQRFGVQAVPWLVADGYIANFRDELDSLPLIMVTSSWVKEVYMRDGIHGANIDVLPVGCDTDAYLPRDAREPMVAAVREALGITPEQIMILTVGGDAASKGAQEVMQALAQIDREVPDWRYVCKVWPQPRTTQQNAEDWELARQLGIEKKVIYATGKVSRNFMPYLLAACDIYAGPSRLEGFGMPHVEANACAKPVIAIDAMAFRDTMVHGETAFLAVVAKENVVREAILGESAGFPSEQRVVFNPPRVADYRAGVPDIARYLKMLLQDADLRAKMGAAGRQRAVEQFDYRVVAKKCIDVVTNRLYAPIDAQRSMPTAV